MSVDDGILSVIQCIFFFFKQKTAYEMRISDWSSDVCSSDLAVIEHEEDFHTPQFLDPAALGRVEEQHLIAPLPNRLGLRDEARGVIAAAFGRPGAARRGAGVILRDPQRHRGRDRKSTRLNSSH